ncbi:hypothetical protein [Thiorhodococcus minor]|uniref:Uncharacterized protein n=1 Tax=Thiorhodococcus minor TaxID=57489 RepID=A0A6M0JWC0_9GAMM|nr:hypothetical protein [Thiorhodococcus minor]NEV60903.1 hypothetical protein [Thiorhodococcus minor]
MDPATSSEAGAARATPDLIAPSLSLLPEFPLERDATSLALYPGTAQELRARWTLRPDDFISYGAGFPIDAGRPEAVLRLRRLSAEGGSETAQEIRLRLQGIGGEGDAGFRVEGDYSAFEAELGLSSEAGGWLLLARSNRLQQATGIGLEALDALQRPMPPAASRPSPVSVEPGERAATSGGAPDVGQRWQVQSGLLPSHGTSDAHPGPGAALGLGSSDSATLGSQMTGEEAGGIPALSVQMQPGGEGGGNATLAPIERPRLMYGEPCPTGAGLVVEAELRIRGWAPPNSEIDLFGHPYRVGPGGGFQLVLKVDDAELLKRALDLHLPPEIGSRREH